ncbi:MAG: hypothetical protein ABI852_19030, partial [Gemmatimonadaceae bacterium]
MNAHERLRLYLEQRRELGESELVLDALPVDAVLKMIGAPAGKGASPRAASGAPNADRAQPASQQGGSDQTPLNSAPSPDALTQSAPDATSTTSSAPPTDPAPRFNSTATTDWRAALSDLAPGAEQKATQRASNANNQQPIGNAAAITPPKIDATRDATIRSDSGSSVAPTTNAASI